MYTSHAISQNSFVDHEQDRGLVNARHVGLRLCRAVVVVALAHVVRIGAREFHLLNAVRGL